MKTVTKKLFAHRVEKAFRLSPALAADAVENVLTTLELALRRLDSIYIPKVCRIHCARKAARPGRNPKTGEPVTISARYAVSAVRVMSSSGTCLGNKFNKGKFIIELSKLYSVSVATDLVNLFYTLVRSVDAGECRIEFRGFGVFEPRRREERKGRNPKTGEKLTFPASNHVGFKASRTLLAKINAEHL